MGSRAQSLMSDDQLSSRGGAVAGLMVEIGAESKPGARAGLPHSWTGPWHAPPDRKGRGGAVLQRDLKAMSLRRMRVLQPTEPMEAFDNLVKVADDSGQLAKSAEKNCVRVIQRSAASR